MSRAKCEIEHCTELLGPNARLPTCYKCRNVFRYWRKKTPAELMDRQGRLIKWQDRMIHMGAEDRRYGRAARAIEKSRK